jgi:galactoside 2-L-fucosyltransferase 1/2
MLGRDTYYGLATASASGKTTTEAAYIGIWVQRPAPAAGYLERQKAERLQYYPPCPLPNARITVNDGGRFGNVMGEYATMYAHAKRLSLQPFVAPSMKTKLMKVFRNITIKSDTRPSDALQIGFEVLGTTTNCSQLFKDLRTRTAVIRGFPLDVLHFHQFRNELLREFEFQSSLLERVSRFLTGLKKGDEEVVFVGMHVRRTDYR